MKTTKTLTLFLIILFNISFSYSKNKTNQLKINANETKIIKNDMKIIFSGNVISKYENNILKSDKMIVYYKMHKNNYQLDKIEVFGNIQFTGNDISVNSSKASYDNNTNILTLQDNIKANQNNKTIYADKIFYNIKTKKTKIQSSKEKKIKIFID